MTFRPAGACGAIRRDDPGWSRSLFGSVLHVALRPGSAWPVGHALAGSLPWSAAAFATSFLSTLGFTLASVVLLGIGFFALSAFFTSRRQWRGCLAVAAFASTPVLLAG